MVQMGRTYSPCGGRRNVCKICITSGDPVGDLGVEGGIMLKCISGEFIVKLYSGLN
jgi:hypothetical protein